MTRAVACQVLAWLGVWAGALAWLVAPLPAAAQLAPNRPMAGGNAGVRVNLLLDQRRIAEARKKVSPDGDFTVYSYTLRPGNPWTELRPDNAQLLRRWKGDFVLGDDTAKSTFESAAQFLPAMLVLDVTNESGAPQQVASAYLAVESSTSDKQPFLQLQSFFSDNIDVRNFGWGQAENAQLNFAFGPQQPVSNPMTMNLGAFGSLEISAARALGTLVPPLPKLQNEPPRCRNMAQVPSCYAQLQRLPGMGRLGEIAYVKENRVLTRLIGKLSYQWRDATGAVKQREHPVNVQLELFRFNVGEGAEMGAPAPEETGFSTVTLALDRKDYRVPLPYRPRIGAGENKRFQLALAAPKSSSHVFRVVLEMTDGSRVESAPVDWLYFLPFLDLGEARQVR